MQLVKFINDINLSKRSLAQLGKTDASNLLDGGEHSPVEMMIRLKALQEYIASFESVLKSAAIIEFENLYSKMDNVILGAEVRTSQRQTFAYEDNILSRIQDEMNVLKEKQKERELFLKALPSEQVDAETGEISKPAKVIKTTSILTITLPK